MKPEACRIDYLKNHLLPKTDFEGRDSKNDREAISNYSCTSLQAIALLTLNRLPRNIVLSHQMNGHAVFEAMSCFKILPLIVICTCVAIIVRFLLVGPRPTSRKKKKNMPGPFFGGGEFMCGVNL